MSVIVKSGGGKSSGLYVWKKYNVVIGFGESRDNIALANDGTSIDTYVKENLYIKDDGTIGVQGEPYSTVSISSVIEDTTIGGVTPTKYCIGVDGNVYSSPRSHIVGSVDNCAASLVEVVKSTFIDFVVSDSETTYPNGGYKNGYWYELYGLPINIVTWANGTDEEIVAMVEAADQGLINLSDYWAVGDTRTVQLSAMSATGVGESHAAQQVDLVLMHAGGYTLNAAVASGRTKCSFVVGLKDSLKETGYMNSSYTNSGSWDGSDRRTWCNNVFRNAIPSTLRAIFKQFKTITAETYNGSTNQESVDYFALPAAKEVFGGSATSAGSATSFSNLTEFNALFQFDYYKTTSNRVKKLGKTGTASGWWGRSPYYDDSNRFCGVDSGGAADFSDASSSYGLAPFGCI